jgi:hypothetical protein
MLEDLSGIVERRVNAAGTMPSEVAPRPVSWRWRAAGSPARTSAS